MAPRTRRRYLAAIGSLSIGGLAACLGDDGVADVEDDEGEPPMPNDDDDDDDQEAAHTDGEDIAHGDDVEFAVEEITTGLEHPWGMAVLPGENAILVTERPGRLQRVHRGDGSVEFIDGTPEVFAQNQGGLLDVTLHPEFDDNGWVYLTYSIEQGGDATTALGSGRLVGETLEDFSELYVVEPLVPGDAHFGSRVVFGPDDMVYMTTGDRQLKQFDEDHYSQDLRTPLGSVVRLTPDGEVPDDNPFVDEPDADGAIHSYGIRNAQGLTVQEETGDLWFADHGEQDGDEINVLEAGGNYGWPIAHYGCTYGAGEPIGDLPHERDDVVDPVFYWECNTGGFPPSGMTFYTGDTFAGWEGDLFVGNLAGHYLGRFSVDGRDVEEEAPILEDREWRVRDVTVAPETHELYILVDDSDAPLVRLTTP